MKERNKHNRRENHIPSRTATVAACFLEESAALQLRMLSAAGGDAARIRSYTREQAERLSDQLSPAMVERAWEYYAALASTPA